MRNIIIVLLLCLLPLTVFAEQKYNLFSNRWETVPDSSQWKTQWNPWNNTWSYQPEGAKPEYNPFENKWEWNSGHNPPDYE